MTRRRRWFWVTTVALAVVSALVIGLLPVVIERAAVAWLRTQGLDGALRVHRPGLHRTRISELRLGREPALLIQSLELGYAPSRLLRGRLETIRARGVTLRARLGEDGALSFGELDALLPAPDASPAASGAPALLPDRIGIEEARLLVATPRGDWRVEGSARLALAAGSVDALHSKLTLRDDAGDLDAALELALDPAGALSGSARLDARRGAALDAILPALAGLESASLALELEGEAAPGRRELSLRVSDCARLRLGPGALPGGLRLVRAHELCLRTPETSALVLDAARAELHWVGPLEIAPTALDLRGEASRVWARGTSPRVRLVPRRPDGLALDLTTSDGELELPDAELRLAGIELATALDLSRPASPAPELGLRVARLTTTATSPTFAPAALRARASWEAPSLVFRGTLTDLVRPIALHFDGRHDTTSGRGNARLRLPALRLAPGGIRLEHLSPRFSGLVERVEGELGAHGRLGWSDAGTQASLELTLDALALDSRYANVEGAGGTLRFESVLPLRTQGLQQLRFAKLDAGIVLTDGEVGFALDADGSLRVEGAEGHLAGGLLRAQGVLDFEAESQRLRFQLRQVELASLLELADVEGLAGSGVLHGEIPLQGDQGRLVIAGGRLEASAEGGVIRYRPAVAPPALDAAGSGGKLLALALQDFRYERLRARIDGDLAEEVQAVVELFGSSPHVEEGRPIELTLRLGLTGTLRELLRTSDLTRWLAPPTPRAQGTKP